MSSSQAEWMRLRALEVVRAAGDTGITMPDAIAKVLALEPNTKEWEVRHVVERLMETGDIRLNHRLHLTVPDALHRP